MKRHLVFVDGKYDSVRLTGTFDPSPDEMALACGTKWSERNGYATPAEQAAYEFGRQEKAQEILEALTREFFKEKKK